MLTGIIYTVNCLDNEGKCENESMENMVLYLSYGVISTNSRKAYK